MYNNAYYLQSVCLDYFTLSSLLTEKRSNKFYTGY